MISTIIVGSSSALREQEAFALCKQLDINTFDREVFSPPTPEEKTSQEEAFGIQLVRKIKHKATFKPTYSSQRAIIILEAQLLTLPAQQSLLKLLEEPPQYTIIFLTAQTERTLLPTISSRCRIISLKEEEKEDEELDFKEVSIDDKDMSLQKQLSLSESIIQSGKAAEWMRKYIRLLREHLLHPDTTKDAKVTHLRRKLLILEKAQEAYMLLTTTNVNQRLIIEHFFFKSSQL